MPPVLLALKKSSLLRTNVLPPAVTGDLVSMFVFLTLPVVLRTYVPVVLRMFVFVTLPASLPMSRLTLPASLPVSRRIRRTRRRRVLPLAVMPLVPVRLLSLSLCEFYAKLCVPCM